MTLTDSLTPAQVDALFALQELWGPERITLIGAAALSCFLEMRWRETHDLDIALAVDITDCPKGLRDELGWAQDARLPYRWYAAGGVQLDVLPVDDEVLRAGEIEWPGTDRRLDLTGFRLTRDHAELVELRPASTVRVAPVPVLAVLKIAAYRDRPAERHRDLADLGHVFDAYPSVDDMRRYLAAYDFDLSYAESGPHVLGSEVRAIVNSHEHQLVVGFAREAVRGEVLTAALASGAPHDYQGVLTRWGAFLRAVEWTGS